MAFSKAKLVLPVPLVGLDIYLYGTLICVATRFVGKLKLFYVPMPLVFFWFRYWSDTLMEKHRERFREENAEENIWT
jgi:hypothetical protein